MDFQNTRRRPATSFVRSRHCPSVIVDRYASKQKLANSEIIQKPTAEGLRANYLKLTQALEEEKNNQKSYLEREKYSSDKSERQQKEIYHNFCIDFSKKKSIYHKEFNEVSKSARSRKNDLKEQTKDLEDLERETYRLEMGLDDPPIYEEKKEPIFVNKNTDYGIYDAKFSLSLAKFKTDNIPK